MRAKLICEFERGVSPKKSLGLGKEHIRKIINDYKVNDDIGHRISEFTITDDLKVKIIPSWNEAFDSIINDIGNKHKEIKFELEHFFGEDWLNEVEWDIIERSVDVSELDEENKLKYYVHNLYDLLVNKNLDPSDSKIADLMDEIENKSGISSGSELLSAAKHTFTNIFSEKLDDLGAFLSEYKSEDDEFIQEDYSEYIFIARPDYKETIVNGKTYHDKTIYIENLYKFNKYSTEGAMAMAMMKARAPAQGEGSKFYHIYIPKYLHDKDTAQNEEIGDELRDYIETMIKRK